MFPGFTLKHLLPNYGNYLTALYYICYVPQPCSLTFITGAIYIYTLCVYTHTICTVTTPRSETFRNIQKHIPCSSTCISCVFQTGEIHWPTEVSPNSHNYWKLSLHKQSVPATKALNIYVHTLHWFRILSRSFGEKTIFLQSCETKSGTESLGSRLGRRALTTKSSLMSGCG